MDLVREFRRGAVALHVLHHASEGAVHGAWLSEELARHGYQISPGTLYPLLHRMAAAGLIAGSEEVVDGRVIRRYRATKRGEESLAQLRGAIRELSDEVGSGGAKPEPPRTRRRAPTSRRGC
jgi:DNA-binding PadR family transcriptional regulator